MNDVPGGPRTRTSALHEGCCVLFYGNAWLSLVTFSSLKINYKKSRSMKQFHGSKMGNHLNDYAGVSEAVHSVQEKRKKNSLKKVATFRLSENFDGYLTILHNS